MRPAAWRRARVAVATTMAGSLLALLTGCSSGTDAAPPAVATSSAPAPAYDAALPPASALLALVPDRAVSLTVTDLAQVRLDLGVSDLSSRSPLAERTAFWRRADASSPLLTRGMLLPVDDRVRTGFGFGEDDVSVEAHFFDATGHQLGWILIFSSGVDMSRVQAAITAGVGPLVGGTVHATNRLVASGITTDSATSWAADPTTRALVGGSGDATYVQRACVPDITSAARLEPLTQWSMVFGDSLATATLDAPTERTDLFARLALATGDAAFRAGFTAGVADPSSARLGFEMVDPATAARLTLRGRLPFAACA